MESQTIQVKEKEKSERVETFKYVVKHIAIPVLISGVTCGLISNISYRFGFRNGQATLAYGTDLVFTDVYTKHPELRETFQKAWKESATELNDKLVEIFSLK